MLIVIKYIHFNFIYKHWIDIEILSNHVFKTDKSSLLIRETLFIPVIFVL